MSDDQERHDEALVPQSTRGLIKKSTGLVRRGLDDLVRAHLPRHSLEVNSLGMEFILVPAGTFMMGSDAKEDEQPIHEVTIGEPFYMGRYLVTQNEWQQVMGNNPSKYIDDDYPVHSVSWDDAQEFIRRLNSADVQPTDVFDGRTGKTRPIAQFQYRLPSEAEWEYACRTGLSGRFDAGEYSMSIYGDAAYAAFPASTRPPFDQRPVGKKRANAFGLFDMLGGYKEWCADRYHVDYNGAPSDGAAWGAIAGEENRVPQMNRVARGAFSDSPSTYWRAAARSSGAPSSRGVIFSFRLVAIEKQRESTVLGAGAD